VRRGALAVLLAAACARTVAAPAVTGPPPAWPAAPAQPRVRFAAQFPREQAELPPRSVWARFWNAVTGLDDAEEAGPELGRPFGVAAAGDHLYVADPDGAQVLRADWKTGVAEPVTCAGRPWVAPMAVALAAAGVLWVADAGAHALVRVTSAGCTAVGESALLRPTAVALAGGRVYTVDPPRHAVVGFSPDGAEVVRLGARGDGKGQLNFPTGVSALADGTLLVVDALNFRIDRFSADGEWLGGFGSAGDGAGAFGRPKAVASDGEGRIYVTDTLHDVVLVFSPEGEFQLAFGGSGAGPGRLTLPAGVAVAEAHVFVADSYNRRVQIYQLAP
jgi:DNA-binding beta-propeller fold protein YncE